MQSSIHLYPKHGCTTEIQIRRGLQLFSPQYLSHYQTKPYVVGTQKNRLSETIRLSTYNIGLADKIRILEQANRSLSRVLHNQVLFSQFSKTNIKTFTTSVYRDQPLRLRSIIRVCVVRHLAFKAVFIVDQTKVSVVRCSFNFCFNHFPECFLSQADVFENIQENRSCFLCDLKV